MSKTGGRMTFDPDVPVRILKMDGKISKERYTVETPRADNKGTVILKNPSGKIEKVRQSRIIASVEDGCAAVIPSNNKYYAVCPECPNVFDISPDNIRINCPEHGKFNLHWIGERPMTTETENTSTEAEATTATTEETQTNETAQVSTVKTTKKKKVAEKVDLSKLASTKDCELWTKESVQFNHQRVAVASHVLIFTGEEPRKVCFNTYDGTLGKSGKQINVDAFVANDTESLSQPVYAVKNLEKERKTLAGKQYVKK